LPRVRTLIATLIAAGCMCFAACGDDDEDEATAPAVTAEDIAPPDDPAEDQHAGGTFPGGAPSADQSAPTSLEDVIAAVLTGSEDPAVTCDELVTERFVREAYGGREGCIAAQQPGSLARSVKIKHVSGSGQSASAVAVPTGGPYDGVDVEAELVSGPEREGAWQVDSLFADVPAGP
jgi:hypothetical protein